MNSPTNYIRSRVVSDWSALCPPTGNAVRPPSGRHTRPIYGSFWLHVEDHCRGIEACLTKGKPGETYNFGGRTELSNLAVIDRIRTEVDRLFAEVDGLAERYPNAPAASAGTTFGLRTFVQDRVAHDRRYAIDDRKAKRELGFSLQHKFDSGLCATLSWYVENDDWWYNLRAFSGRDDPEQITRRSSPV